MPRSIHRARHRLDRHRPAYASLVGPIAPAGSPLAAPARRWFRIARTGLDADCIFRDMVARRSQTLTYAWHRCNANGRVCTAIPNATSASYAVTAADTGHTLIAAVTAATGSTSQTAFSAATALVT